MNRKTAGIDLLTGRYIQSDPIGFDGGINTYVYANANSLRFVDPEGLKRYLKPNEIKGWVAFVIYLKNNQWQKMNIQEFNKEFNLSIGDDFELSIYKIQLNKNLAPYFFAGLDNLTSGAIETIYLQDRTTPDIRTIIALLPNSAGAIVKVGFDFKDKSVDLKGIYIDE